MTNRRNFLETSALSAGALALTPSFANLFAAASKGEVPRRFVFIRKSNGVRPKELALPTFLLSSLPGLVGSGGPRS